MRETNLLKLWSKIIREVKAKVTALKRRGKVRKEEPSTSHFRSK